MTAAVEVHQGGPLRSRSHWGQIKQETNMAQALFIDSIEAAVDHVLDTVQGDING